MKSPEDVKDRFVKRIVFDYGDGITEEFECGMEAKDGPVPFLFLAIEDGHAISARGHGRDEDVAAMIDAFVSKHPEVLKLLIQKKIRDSMIVRVMDSAEDPGGGGH